MHATYKNALMWTLYGVLFLLIAVLQTVVFGRARFFGVKLTLIPVCLACVAMLAGAEAGALYGLCCGAVWCFTGASGGAMLAFMITGPGTSAGVIAGIATIMKRSVASSRTLCQAPFKVAIALPAEAQEGTSSMTENVMPSVCTQ